MAASIVQSTTLGLTQGAQTLTKAITGVTAGNALVVTFVQYSVTANDAPIVKDGTTTLSKEFQYAPGGNYSSVGVAWALNVAAGSHTITLQSTSGNTSNYADMMVHEVAGLGSTQPRVFGVNTITTGTTLSITAGTADAGDISFTVVGSDGQAAAGTAAFTDPSGYSPLWSETNASSYQPGAAAYEILTSTGALSLTWTGLNGGGTNDIGGIAVVFAAAGATTVSADGVVKVTPAMAGSTASSSTASGAINVAPALAGTTADFLAAAGAIQVAPTLAGDTTSSSTAIGAPSLVPRMAGTANPVGVTHASGAVSFSPAVAGTETSTATATGAVETAFSAQGSGVSSATATGAVQVSPQAAGTEASTANAHGAVQVAPIFSGTLDTPVGVLAIGVVQIQPSMAGTTTAYLGADGAVRVVPVIGALGYTVATSLVASGPSTEYDADPTKGFYVQGDATSYLASG